MTDQIAKCFYIQTFFQFPGTPGSYSLEKLYVSVPYRSHSHANITISCVYLRYEHTGKHTLAIVWRYHDRAGIHGCRRSHVYHHHRDTIRHSKFQTGSFCTLAFCENNKDGRVRDRLPEYGVEYIVDLSRGYLDCTQPSLLGGGVVHHYHWNTLRETTLQDGHPGIYPFREGNHLQKLTYHA